MDHTAATKYRPGSAMTRTTDDGGNNSSIMGDTCFAISLKYINAGVSDATLFSWIGINDIGFLWQIHILGQILYQSNLIL